MASVFSETDASALRNPNSGVFELHPLGIEMSVSNGYKKFMFSPLSISNLFPNTLIAVLKPYRLVSSAGYVTVHSVMHPLSRSLESLFVSRCDYNRYPVTSTRSLERLFSTSHERNRGSQNLGRVDFRESELKTKKSTQKQVFDIIEAIRSDQTDLEQKLNAMNLVDLSVDSVREVCSVLNQEKLSALHFFEWVRHSRPSLYGSSDICSLIVDNCGRLGDYKRMSRLLNEFNSMKIHLNERAFGYLLLCGSSKASIVEVVNEVIEVLNGVGGSCRHSAICALIKKLCILESFDVANFVIERTGRRVTHYNILIVENCRRGRFKEAQGIIDEIWKSGCDLNVKTCNHLLSSLCKSGMLAEASNFLSKMEENSCFPDQITFEIFIYYYCRIGRLDLAAQSLEKMVVSGLDPRLLTHAAFIKGYFYSRRYQEAYNYVVDSSIKYRSSSNNIYSLLASLHQEKGYLIAAQNILTEMMNKRLKPDFPVYRRTLKSLLRSGRKDLATDLENRFSMWRLKSSEDAVE